VIIYYYVLITKPIYEILRLTKNLQTAASKKVRVDFDKKIYFLSKLSQILVILVQTMNSFFFRSAEVDFVIF